MRDELQQLPLEHNGRPVGPSLPRSRRNATKNKMDPEDRPVHEWYRFVLSFPPHLVRDYIRKFNLDAGARVLDPFCGTGTTLVECKKLGIESVGVEATPMGHLASRTKVNWQPNPEDLLNHARGIAESTRDRFECEGISDTPLMSAIGDMDLRALPPARQKLLLKNSISSLPMHKTLTLLDVMSAQHEDEFDDHEKLALATALTGPIGNLRFGPEVGVGPAKPDTPVIAPWIEGVGQIHADLTAVRDRAVVFSQVHHADARNAGEILEPGSIDAVITSPPYPNEKDYSRTTRLESVILGFIHDSAELRAMKKGLLRSNTRGVYKADTDDEWVANHPEIQRIASEIEARRIELGKTSGFERQYNRVTKLYFGGMMRHLAGLRIALKPGAMLGYVVGDQASYLRVMIRTGQILADLAETLGYEVVNIDLFRTRLATATREQLREEVVVLRWPG